MGNNKGYIYSIISAIFFGSAGLLIKLVYKTGLDAISLLTAQYMTAVVLMFLIALIKNKKSLFIGKKEIIRLFILGVFGNTIMTIFYYKAFEYLPVAMVAMLLYTYPILVLIYSTVVKREKLTKNKIKAIIFAFTGTVFALNIVSGKLSYSLMGIIFGLATAVFYAFMNIYSEEKLKSIDPLTINLYSTLFSLIVLIIIKFPSFIFTKEIYGKNLIYIVLLAFFCEIVPLTLLYSAIKYIGAFKVSIISNLEIPTAIIISVFFLKEQLSFIQIAGSFLIVYAVYAIKEKSEKP